MACCLMDSRAGDGSSVEGSHGTMANGAVHSRPLGPPSSLCPATRLIVAASRNLIRPLADMVLGFLGLDYVSLLRC